MSSARSANQRRVSNSNEKPDPKKGGAMTTVLAITDGLLATAGLLILIRLLRGPTIHDRLVALDTFVTIVISGMLVESARRDESANIIVLIVVALVGFLSTLSAVRLMPDEELP